MKAIRIHPSPGQPWSPNNPAPSASLHLDDVPIPSPSHENEVLVKITATTVVRDQLTWPESLETSYQIPGNDFAGVVEAVHACNATGFTPGDEVFGMIDPNPTRGTWAEYCLVQRQELALKPPNLSWQEAASVPLSALTAWQALFQKAGLAKPNLSEEMIGRSQQERRVLIIGAAGAVGVWAVQLAALAGCRVVAASSSNARNKEFLSSLGAHEVIEYQSLSKLQRDFNIVIDTVGGEVLENTLLLPAAQGIIVSVDSASYNFEHSYQQSVKMRDDVRAMWFIVGGNSDDLEQVSKALTLGRLRTFVARDFRIRDAREAYDVANSRGFGRGKVVLSMGVAMN